MLAATGEPKSGLLPKSAGLTGVTEVDCVLSETPTLSKPAIVPAVLGVIMSLPLPALTPNAIGRVGNEVGLTARLLLGFVDTGLL